MSRRDNWAWLVACLVLVGGVIGMQAGMRWLKWQFNKEPLPLRKPFTALPQAAGVYQLISELAELPPEIERSLAADAHITRMYHDTRFSTSEPGGLIRLHLAYYSGMTETMIGHRPEVCYVAAGAAAQGLRGSWLHLPDPVNARFFQFIPPGRSRLEGVYYFFVANGELAGTTTGVRLLDLRMTDRYSYWCKVEVLAPGVGGELLVRRAVEPFLQEVLPQVMECLPAWRRGRGEE